MRYKLKDICDMQSGGTPKRGVQEYYDGSIPWATITDFGNAINGEILLTKEYITSSGLKSINSRFFKKGTLLLAMYGSVGKTAIAGIELSTNQAILGINTKNEDLVSNNYLKYWFDYNKDFLYSQGKGATLHNISLTVVKRQEIELPDIQTQNKIVAILDKANSLITKREESIQMLDELLRATFLDMFGDPISNSKNWNIELLGEIAKLERGRFSPRPRNDPSYFGGEYPFIQTGDISRSGNRLSNYTQTLNDKGIKVSKKFKKGIIVIAIVGATIGATAILQIDVYATDSIIGITVQKSDSNAYFLEFVLQFWKPILLANAPEAARPNINLQILNKLGIIIPSFALQNQFARIVEKTESLKSQYQQSLQELENLFGVLSQKAFKGELDLGKMELTEPVELLGQVAKVSVENEVLAINIPTNKKPFAKQVLGGKIISLFKDKKEFTHIKFQKLQYLAEHLFQSDLGSNYYRQCAGPYDPAFMHSVATKMKANKWYQEVNYKFTALEKVKDIDKYFNNYFGNKQEKMDLLYQKLANASEKFCEAVATIYAVWNNRIILKLKVNTVSIKKDFFAWSTRKTDVFTEEEFDKAFAWMANNGFAPVGFGRLIKEKK
jgi:type I restriction enzyme, S subunit